MEGTGGMIEHTPAPWTAERNDHGWSVSGQAPRPDDYPKLWFIARTESNEPEDEANARLIAAAPDLLAACKLLLTFTEDVRLGLGAAFDVTRAAIAKAEG